MNESLSQSFRTRAHRINSAKVCSGHKHIFTSLTLLVNSIFLSLLSICCLTARNKKWSSTKTRK